MSSHILNGTLCYFQRMLPELQRLYLMHASTFAVRTSRFFTRALTFAVSHDKILDKIHLPRESYFWVDFHLLSVDDVHGPRAFYIVLCVMGWFCRHRC